jgi:hypothetical protein
MGRHRSTRLSWDELLTSQNLHFCERDCALAVSYIAPLPESSLPLRNLSTSPEKRRPQQTTSPNCQSGIPKKTEMGEFPVVYFGAGFLRIACAAASLASGTLNGLQET